ncbi:ATP-binding protein [Actinoplanes sp. NPDC049596]|uniref:ATP-binding protein n=1 Tax=unclassified Actinoplanes TaxID=2626549 RepID=UPI003449F98E
MRINGESRGLALAVSVALVGLVIFGLVYVGMRSAQEETAERVMDQRTAMARAAVQSETERFRSLVEATAAGLGTDAHLTWDDFNAATAPLSSAELIGAASLAFIVPSSTVDIPDVQKFWRGRGAKGLVLRPAGDGEHYFTIFTRTLNTAGPALNGLDASAAPEAAEALQDARRTGRPSVSGTYVLLRDRNLPAARQQHSFVFAAPVWTRTSSPVFRGWMVLGLRGQDFLRGVLATVSQGQLEATLLAADRDGERPAVARFEAGGAADLERRSDIQVADREWTLITQADARLLPGATSPLPLIVLLGGIALSLILSGLVYTLATSRARALTRVEQATAELRDAEAESRRHAGLLGAIMDSIGDGVGVVDERGAFLLHNPAARQLLGGMEDADDPGSWQQHYGLYEPDGRTPFPMADLPLIRALRGESSDGVEMIVRNSRRPEGILVSVDGRPLRTSAGLRGAVAVFHDITELRRYENDLAVFAGVVAHDLKAPLAVIRGHCEAAIEELADAPASAAGDVVRDDLGRIVRAVDRMAGLIDTLLAYSTARDAPLHTRRVDLGALIAEVVRDRVEHLKPEERPDIYAGPMPEVRADPAMLRHVLDNLVGNALKYVRPGVTPRVDVTGEALTAHWARIEVADRGIGIPDEDKPRIFESFHRAQTAAGYAGTGLGLAICQRIVERHGGEIGVADNPGGGTRFHFTVPIFVPAEEPGMSRTDTDDEAATRAALERALAERAAIENTRLPGLGALPSSAPSGHNPAAVPLRAPVPERPPATAE